MDELIELTERPTADEVYMIAGWRQWADAGEVSSSLPAYLAEQMRAREIGRVDHGPFYIFQVPGTHHFLRPEVKLEDGYPKELETPQNQIFYTGDERRGLVIFLGDEPQINVERYANDFFEIVRELNVKRVIGLGGVYGAVPYDKDREIACAYSLRRLKKELEQYALRFSNYEGGTTIGTYLAAQAGQRGLEFITLYAMVPMYDLSQLSAQLRSMTIEEDYKAWYDIMERLNHMLKLGFDLTDLENKSRALLESVEEQVKELETSMPDLEIREYLSKLTESFTETPYLPLDEAWESGLGDILRDLE